MSHSITTADRARTTKLLGVPAGGRFGRTCAPKNLYLSVARPGVVQSFRFHERAFCSGSALNGVSTSKQSSAHRAASTQHRRLSNIKKKSAPTNNNNNTHHMVVVRRRQLGLMSRSKDSAGEYLTNSSAHISVAGAEHSYDKSLSTSSLRGNNSSHKHHKPSNNSSVCFAGDYGSPDQVSSAPPPLSPLEHQACFYTKDDLNRFDKDRALTVLMYRTRKSHNVPWDDNLHSLRGLEEYLQTKSSSSSKKSSNGTERGSTKRGRRNDVITAVLKEQERLKTPAVARELAAAAQAMMMKTSNHHSSSNNNNNNNTNNRHQQQPHLCCPMTERDVYDELLRGVSCSLSKVDKQRAIGLAQKDEKSAGRHWQRTGSRRMLMSLKTKLSSWVTTSNSSLAESVKSCTSNNSGSSGGTGGCNVAGPGGSCDCWTESTQPTTTTTTTITTMDLSPPVPPVGPVDGCPLPQQTRAITTPEINHHVDVPVVTAKVASSPANEPPSSSSSSSLTPNVPPSHHQHHLGRHQQPSTLDPIATSSPAQLLTSQYQKSPDSLQRLHISI